jgi:hypothetical protein
MSVFIPSAGPARGIPMVNGFSMGCETRRPHRFRQKKKKHEGLIRLRALCGKSPYFVAELNAGGGYCGSFSRVRFARWISSSPNSNDGPTIALGSGSERL